MGTVEDFKKRLESLEAYVKEQEDFKAQRDEARTGLARLRADFDALRGEYESRSGELEKAKGVIQALQDSERDLTAKLDVARQKAEAWNAFMGYLKPAIIEAVKETSQQGPIDLEARLKLILHPTKFTLEPGPAVHVTIDEKTVQGQIIRYYQGLPAAAKLTVNAVMEELVRRAYWKARSGSSRMQTERELEGLVQLGLMDREERTGSGWLYFKSPDFDKLLAG